VRTSYIRNLIYINTSHCYTEDREACVAGFAKSDGDVGGRVCTQLSV